MKRYVYLISILIVALLTISGCNLFPIAEQKGSVTGTVVDQNNSPIKDVTITIKNSNNYVSKTTNSQGVFSYTDLTVGSYTFVATIDGYESNEATVIVEANVTKTFQIQLTKIANNGSINGLVKDVDTNTPLSGAVVTITDTDYQATTGTDGKFTFADIAAGEYELVSQKDGYNDGFSQVTVVGGEVSEVILTMEEPRGNIVGSVKEEATGNPIEGVVVVIEQTNMSCTTDTAGNFSFTHLVPGNYTLNAKKDSYYDASAAVTVVGGEDTQVTLAMEFMSGNIVGQVTDLVSKDPIEGVLVELDEFNISTTTDSAGSFSFTNLAIGEYSVIATMDTYKEARKTITVLPGEDVIANFTLEHLPIIITGIVSNSADDTALEGAEVSILDQVTTTDINGEYSITLVNAQAGTYTLTVSCDFFNTISQDIAVNYGENILNYSLEPVTKDDLIDEAYNLVSNVEDSLYQIGSICIEQGNIAGEVAEEINLYMSQITPYLIDATMGLGHLAVFGENSPGFPGVYDYIYDTQFEYGYYELIEKGDLEAETWEWIINDAESGLVVTITAPNVYDFIVMDKDLGSVIDLTNCTFTYDIVTTYDPDTTYHAEVAMGSGDPLVITDGFDSFILPSGDTASLYAEIIPANPTVGSITLDTALLLDQLDQGAFSVEYVGSLDTPVLDYEGNLSIDFGMNLDFMPTWADVCGSGVFTTSQFTLSGGFDFAFNSEVWLNEYDEYVFAYRMDHVNFNCSYQTVTGSTTFEGYLGYQEYENYRRDDMLVPLVYDVYIGGSLTHNDNFYNVDVKVYDYTTGMDITADIASNEYHLVGYSSIDFDEDTATMNFVDDNGIEIEMNMYADPWNEPIGFMSKYDEKLADIRFVENEIFGVVLEVAFENGEFIWFPWDPRVYLFNDNVPR